MEERVDVLDGTPSKRFLLSIIADYDINKAVCELIDNAIDIWTANGKHKELLINVDIDINQQNIKVNDDAGGVKEENLSSLISPGQTQNSPESEIIGLFGVGTKRAVVALGQDVTILTRYKNNKTFRIKFDDAWLEDSTGWTLPYYQVDNIPDNSTVIEIQKLRSVVTEEIIKKLIAHLGATYSRFLSSKANISVNGERVTPLSFENWAYPPEYLPTSFYGTVPGTEDNPVKVEILAGLSSESSPASGEYGVYVYCNNRLIAGGLKTYAVGFGSGLAGLPHPSLSLMKVIISLTGPAKLMPWNSSKSDINAAHPTFNSIRKWVFAIVKDYASLSRRLEGRWSSKVFKYKSGNIRKRKITDFDELTQDYFPPLPVSKPRYAIRVKTANTKIGLKKPWTVGLYESIVAVDLISKQNLEQKNRICLLILDSTLEIAFKEYLVNESGRSYSNPALLKLFNNREDVHREIRNFKSLNSFKQGNVWKLIKYYYDMRCDLIHRKTTVQVRDKDIEVYRKVVEYALKELFGKLRF